MDKDTELHILNVLREGTIRWFIRNECLNRGRRQKLIGKTKDGEPKYLWERNCDECDKWFFQKDSLLEVDHINPIGSFNGNFDDYIRRMYCGLDNLQALCFSCHKRKTAKQAASKRFVRKNAIDEL